MNAAIASGQRSQVIALAQLLDGFNTAGCPGNKTACPPQRYSGRRSVDRMGGPTRHDEREAPPAPPVPFGS
jgi:hypothetical protein